MTQTSKATYEQLQAARSDLNDLIAGTKSAIGQIARQGFEALDRLPPASGFPVISRPKNVGLYAQRRRIVHATVLPKDPVAMPNGMIVTQAATERVRSQHTVLRGMTGRSQVLSEMVSVGVHVAGAPEATYSIATSGAALYRYGKDLTNPAEPGTKQLNGSLRYESVDMLHAAYVKSFVGALTVAGLVTEGLQRTHGIYTDADTEPLHDYLANWAAKYPGGTMPRPELAEAMQQVLPAGPLS